jgi:hypothetical protein
MSKRIGYTYCRFCRCLYAADLGHVATSPHIFPWHDDYVSPDAQRHEWVTWDAVQQVMDEMKATSAQWMPVNVRAPSTAS